MRLWLCDVDADLDVASTLLDILDLMGVPIHVTCLGEVAGAAIGLLVTADQVRDYGLIDTVGTERVPGGG